MSAAPRISLTNEQDVERQIGIRCPCSKRIEKGGWQNFVVEKRFDPAKMGQSVGAAIIYTCGTNCVFERYINEDGPRARRPYEVEWLTEEEPQLPPGGGGNSGSPPAILGP